MRATPLWLLTAVGCADKIEGPEPVDLNHLPVVVGLALTPSTVYAGDTITAEYEVWDEDGDEIGLWFEWRVDGVVLSDELDLLEPFSAGGGAEVEVELTLADEFGFGDPAYATITLLNSPPRVDSVTITPDPALTADELTCAYTATDDDGDSIEGDYAWSVNGASAGVGQPTLPGGFVRGDVVACEVTVIDGRGESGGARDEIVISNTPPGAPEITLDPAPGSPCSRGGAYVSREAPDADGDPVSYTWSWRDASGAEVISGERYPEFSFTEGDSYSLVVTPSDGFDDGVAATVEFIAAGTGETLGDGRDEDCDGQVDEYLTLAVQADQIWWDDTSNAQAGVAIGAADLDGDGADELAVARAGTSDLLLFAGASMDPEAPRLLVADALLDRVSAAGDMDAGDVDGDGAVELLVGVAGYDGDAGSNSGAAFVLDAGALAGGDIDDLDPWRIEGAGSGDQVGVSVALGDLDGDGLADAAVGAPNEDAPSREAGAVYVFYGLDAASGIADLDDADLRIEGTDREVFFGSSVAVIADLGGDGRPELAAGAPEDDGGGGSAGAVAIFFEVGVGDTARGDADLIVSGHESRLYAGREDAAAADVDGDGRADLLIGSEGDVDALVSPGSLWLISGVDVAGGGAWDLSLAFAAVHGDDHNGGLGLNGGGGKLGDVDGDGLADLAAGAGGAGAIYLWTGATLSAGGAAGGVFSPADAAARITEEAGGDQLGRWVILPDTDGDGELEIATSAYRNDTLANTGGATYVFRPRHVDGAPLYTPECDLVGDLLYCRVELAWADARTFCQRWGGDLARLEGADRNDAAAEAAASRTIPGSTWGAWWIGLTDAASEGTWAWLDESAATAFDAWGSSQPQSSTSRNCAATGGAGPGLWDARDCAEQRFFICEP